MSVTLYFRSGSPSSTTRRYWRGDSLTDGGANGTLTATAGSAASGPSAASVTGPTTTLMSLRAQTDPFSADITISSTISYNLWGLESSMNANASFRVEIYRLQPNGTATLIGSQNNATEFGTAATLTTGNITPSSTAFLAGDAIGVSILFTDAGGTMASGFSLTFRTDGPTAGVDGDSFITFTDNFTTSTTAPGGSILYLTDTASDANPSANVEKALQIDGSAPSTFTKVTNTAAGPTAPVQWTDTAGGTAVEWFTPQLAAVTITAGLMQLSLDLLESAATANASAIMELYSTASDGSSPTLIAKHTLSGAVSVGGVEITTTSADAAIVYSIPVNSVALSDQQRLKIILYIDDTQTAAAANWGTSATAAAMAAGQTVTAQLGGAGGGYLKLPVSVSQFVAGSIAAHIYLGPGVAALRGANW